MSVADDNLPANYCPTCGEELDPAPGEFVTGLRCPEHGRLIVTVTRL